jgi:hypothetical protein
MSVGPKLRQTELRNAEREGRNVQNVQAAVNHGRDTNFKKGTNGGDWAQAMGQWTRRKDFTSGFRFHTRLG